MPKFTSLLVGAYHRPPASLILGALPSGTFLELIPEMDNPYDEFAIKVGVHLDAIPSSRTGQLDEDLMGYGTSFAELSFNGLFHLGYVAASAGKPLAKAKATMRHLVGNQEIAKVMEANASVLDNSDEWDVIYRPTVRLGFGPEGQPLVLVATEG